MPLWATELSPNLTIGELSPLWGIVSNNFENTTGFAFRRAKEYYVPAGSQFIEISGHIDSLASAEVFVGAMHSTYGVGNPPSPLEFSPTYTGESNFALFAKWQKLSKSIDTASIIVNLICVDLIASSTVGTKSLLSSSSTGSQNGNVQASYRASVVRLRKRDYIQSPFCYSGDYNSLHLGHLPPRIRLYCLHRPLLDRLHEATPEPNVDGAACHQPPVPGDVFAPGFDQNLAKQRGPSEPKFLVHRRNGRRQHRLDIQ